MLEDSTKAGLDVGPVERDEKIQVIGQRISFHTPEGHPCQGEAGDGAEGHHRAQELKTKMKKLHLLDREPKTMTISAIFREAPCERGLSTLLMAD